MTYEKKRPENYGTTSLSPEQQEELAEMILTLISDTALSYKAIALRCGKHFNLVLTKNMIIGKVAKLRLPRRNSFISTEDKIKYAAALVPVRKAPAPEKHINVITLAPIPPKRSD